MMDSRKIDSQLIAQINDAFLAVLVSYFLAS